MNRTLVYFSVVLIIIGLLFGIYLIAFVGFLLLLPALLTASRPPAKPTPAPVTQAPRRIIPAPENKPETVPSPGQHMPMPTPMPVGAVPTTSMGQSYSQALFPTPLMPSLSLMGMGSIPQVAKEAVPTKPEGREELVEVVAILALLKLISG